MALIAAGRKYKRPSALIRRCLEAGASDAWFDVPGNLHVEWESGEVTYGAIPSGFDTRFDPQLDWDLK
jgi:hypothetical protein